MASCCETCTEPYKPRCCGASGRSPDNYDNVDAASIVGMSVGWFASHVADWGRLSTGVEVAYGWKVDLAKYCAASKGPVTQPASRSSKSIRAD